MPAARDLTGHTFGRLRVLACAGGAPRSWRCVCTCGVETVVTTGRLRSGNTTSCGCHKRSVLGHRTTKHAGTGTALYMVWKGMRNRCNNPNSDAYKNYGGRGITVCKRWDKFENFLADMGPRPSPAHSLERKNNAKGYSPSNCVWATRKEQNRNTRRVRLVVYKGKEYFMGELADMCGVPRSAAYARAKAGWDLVRACTAPTRTLPLKGRAVRIQSGSL